jgi:hypothetical protein
MRRRVAPLFIGLVAVLAVACAPPPAPPGISFNPPGVGYVGQDYVLKASATNNLPVSFALDPSSTACTLTAGVLSFDAVGSCTVTASQQSDGSTAALPSVTRTISVYECPTLRSGVWTGPQGTSATVVAGESTFYGTVDLSAFGIGVQSFQGTIACDLVQMTFNGTALSGRLSYDGNRITGSYQGISIVLNAPPS